MDRKEIDYLNSPLVILIQYCIMVLTLGINIIIDDLNRNNKKYLENSNNVVIQRTKTNVKEYDMQQNSGSYVKQIRTKLFCW